MATHKGARKVGTARDVAPPDVGANGLELLHPPGLGVGRQGRAGGAQRTHPRQITTARNVQSGFVAVGKVGRACPKKRDFFLRRHAPQNAPVRVFLAAAGVAVVDHAGHAIEQARHLGVPHDPAGGAVPVKALAPAVGVVAAADVVVQNLVGQGHDHGAAVAVHDGLGQTGGAARIDDPQRVVKRQPHRLEGLHLGVLTRGDGRHLHAAAHIAVGQIQCAQVVVHDDVLHAGQSIAQLLHHTHAVKISAAIAHPVYRDQHLGLDLFEAVEHGVGAHVGRANAPHTAHAGGGQKRHHGFGNVGQIRRHPVPRLHALGLQVQRHGSHLAAQFRPAHLTAQAFFVVADDRQKPGLVRGLHMPQHLVRVVGLGSGKPLGARHDVVGQHRRVRRGRLQIKIIPDALPERIQLGDRPAPKVVVSGKAQAALIAQPVLIQANLRQMRRRSGEMVHVVHGLQRSSACAALSRARTLKHAPR